MKKNIKIAVVGILIPVIVVGVTLGVIFGIPPSDGCGEGIWPTDQWHVSTPAEQGMNSITLDDIDTYININSNNISSLTIIRNGYIVNETYYENFLPKAEKNFTVGDWLTKDGEGILHNIYSATKSITSILIGIALKEGFINSTSQTIFDFFPELWNVSYDPLKADITVENLLRMESGIDWKSEIQISPKTDPQYIDPDYLHISDILDWDLIADPGDPFNGWDQYSSDATHVLSAIVNRSSPLTTSEFAKEYLFDPLGITEDEYYWYVDGDGIVAGGSALCLTARAMAKIGYLCLNNGTWNCNEIFTEEYLINATTDYPGTMPYGYQFWLGTNYYYASGAYGQSIYVIPDEDIVVVFTADEGEEYGYIISEYILGSIIN